MRHGFEVATVIGVAILLLSAAGSPKAAFADPTDLVPQGSALLDAFARLADAGAFGKEYTSTDFYQTRRFTRGELAKLLIDDCLQDEDEIKDLGSKAETGTALAEAVVELRPELSTSSAGIDPDLDLPRQSASLSGYLAPEMRALSEKPPFSEPDSALDYRVTDLGELGNHFSYRLSASDWPDDDRKYYVNQVGPHDFSQLNEAALTYDGRKGLTLDAGRLYNQWGPGYLGATVLSDNSPAMDQVRLNFPFSLGSRLGRNYTYTQLASAFDEVGKMKYFQARRVSYQFNGKLSGDYEEALKTNYSGALLLIPLPYYVEAINWQANNVAGIKDGSPQSNFVTDLGLNYAALPWDRLYGQILVDDIKSPTSSASKHVPRKVAYLLGTSLSPYAGTDLVLEYGYVDPTTYTHHAPQEQWTQGPLDEIGIPSGPNSKDLYIRLDHRLFQRLTFTADLLDRRRDTNSFPEPTYRTITTGVTYQFPRKEWVAVSYTNFKEDPFPIAVGSPSYPTFFDTPSSESNQGMRVRMGEWDFTVGYNF